tara:strand:- start:1041 stop:1238 length:198 start_codon:yes stop_codon:yes gene_type:complete
MGKKAEVDADQVKKLIRKEDLIREMLLLKLAANSMTAAQHMIETADLAMKIIRLNRTIRKTVRFL